MQEGRSATYRDPGTYTGIGQVGGGEGCEPVLQRVVVHDAFLFLEVPRACRRVVTGLARQKLQAGVLPDHAPARSGSGSRANAAELACI
jgi:hypothetical protein